MTIITRSGVYSIVSAVGKPYIGSSVDINRRLKRHFYDLKKNKHHNQHLQNSYNLHSECHFSTKTILFCEGTKEMLHFYEQLCVGGLQPAYNICLKVVQSWLGVKRTTATKEKMSISRKNSKVVYSEEMRENVRRKSISNTHAKGNTYSDLQKKAMSDRNLGNKPRLGKRHTLESKAKMSKTKLAKKIKYEEGDVRLRGRKVIDTATGFIYISVTDAAKQLWVTKSHLFSMLNKRTKTKTTLEYIT